jgi:hypothetical protein
MSVYLYGIVGAGIELPRIAGIEGSEVFPVEGGSLVALCSLIDASALAPNEDDLWAHEHVLEAAMEEGPVLPARFGTIFPEESLVINALDERRESLEARLGELEGKVEIGIRAFRPAGPGSRPPEPTDGRSYMLGKLAEHRRAEEERDAGRELWMKVHTALEGLISDHKVRLAPNPTVVFSATYLIDREQADRVVELVDERELPDDIELFYTGPWPPYSFTEKEEEVAR